MPNEIILPVMAVVICVFMVVSMYNRFIKYRIQIEAGWSDIDVALKRRYNLIPGLIKLVQGYSNHEASALDNVIRQRTGDSENSLQAGEQESQISQSLGGLIAVAENYPDLKASQNFVSLQTSLSEIEQEIQNTRTTYNAAVRKYNTHLESFPSNFMASFFSFRKYEYFNLELATQRAVPRIDI